jgi:hypothetical protein
MKFFKSSLSFLLVCLSYSTISIPIITSPPLSAETKSEKSLIKFFNKVGVKVFMRDLGSFRKDCVVNCYIVDEMIRQGNWAASQPLKKVKEDKGIAFTVVNEVSNAALRHGKKGEAILAEFYAYLGVTYYKAL